MMQVSDYQAWLKSFDEARGWDRVTPSQTFVHLIEELGEVARLVLHKEGYKDPDLPNLQEQLAEELADAATFLFKLAYQYDVDLESALAGNQRKCERRTDVAAGQAEMQRYLDIQARNAENMRGNEE